MDYRYLAVLIFIISAAAVSLELAPSEKILDCSEDSECNEVKISEIEHCGTEFLGFEYRSNAEESPYCLSYLNNISDSSVRTRQDRFVRLGMDEGYEETKYSPGLDDAWDLEFTQNGTAIVTEQEGGVKAFNITDNYTNQLFEDQIEVTVDRNSGLMGLAIDPNYEENRRIYLQYSYRNESASPEMDLMNRISSFRFDEQGLTDERILEEGIEINRHHTGGRLEIGPDGALYATVGESNGPSKVARILRLNTETGESEVFSNGHRNPQGIAWHPDTKLLYSSEHGTNRMDEINLIEKGKNYGWPQMLCDGPREEGEISKDSEDPIICFDEWTLAPSGMAFINDSSSTLDGDMLVGGLSGNYIHRVNFEGKDIVKESVFYINTENKEESKLSRRIRDVEHFENSVWALGDKKGLVQIKY